MRDLEYELKTLCHRNRDGSHATQGARMERLRQTARELDGLGFRRLSARNIGEKHVQALVDKWSGDGLATSTIKNRVSDLRWVNEKVGRRPLPASNKHFGISDRRTVADVSKATTLPADKLADISDPHVRASLRLQEQFGLRREEALKIRPHDADRGDQLHLKASWCKGGRERTVPIRTPEQRAALEHAKKTAGTGSLIPKAKSYIEQRRTYDQQVRQSGLGSGHGLRHAYAQRRFQELTGFPCPVAGGPNYRQLTPEQHDLDHAARLIVSEELGHAREQITTAYLGR